MKIMRFFILAMAVWTATATFRCEDPDNSAGGGADAADAWDAAACTAAGYDALGDTQANICSAGTGACTGAECCKTPKTKTWTGGDANSDLAGDQTLTVDAPLTVTCTAGYAAAGANSYDRTLAVDGTTEAGGPCVECNADFTAAGCGNTCITGKIADFDNSCVASGTGCTLGYDNGAIATACAAVSCVDGGDVAPAKGHTCNNSGVVGGTGTACTCDCAAVDFFDGTTCQDAADQTWGGDANSDVPSGNASAVFAAATPITVTCSGSNKAALTSAANGAGGAATYLVNYVGDWKFATEAAPSVWLDTPISCQAVVVTFLWTGGDANSDASGDQQIATGTDVVVTCTAGYGVGTKGNYAATYTIACSAADTCVTTPATSSCGAKVWDVPASTIANTNFADGHDAAEITFGVVAGVAITCNAGYFGTAGKFEVNAAGDVTTTFVTADCTACTVAGSTNTVPTAQVVPANGTGTAGTWSCTEALKSGFSAYTCDTGFTANTAGTACDADAPAASPASGSTSVADSTADSGTSSAFIAGTAIAGIALLL